MMQDQSPFHISLFLIYLIYYINFYGCNSIIAKPLLLSTNFLNYMWITVLIIPIQSQTMNQRANCLIFVQSE